MTLTRTCSGWYFGFCLGWLALATLTSAAPLQLTLDTNLSTIRVSIDAFGQRDTQQTKLAGEIQVEVAPASAPTQIAVGDFSMRTVEGMNFSINFGLLGKATAKVNDLELTRIETPVPLQYVPLSATGGFAVENLRYRTFGDGSYALSGLPCSLAQGSGRECNDSVDFDSGPPGTIGQMTGKLVVNEGKLRLEIEYFFSQPLDPQTPDFATVSGPVTIVATGELPPAEMRLQIQAQSTGQGILLRWPSSAKGLNLVATSDLAAPIDWRPVDATPVTNGEFLEVMLPGAAPERYFRLQ
jgi:hypothetical protein